MFESISPSVKFVGSSAVLIALIRFVRWSVEFACGRLDMRADRVSEREKALEARAMPALPYCGISSGRFTKSLRQPERTARKLAEW